MIIFFCMNLIAGVSVFLLNYRILKFNNVIDSLLSFFVLYFAQIIFTELILGSTGMLYLTNVILVNFAVLLLIWLFTRKRESYIGQLDPGVISIINDKVILCCVCAILGFLSIKTLINLVNPPFGWDSLNYHFTFPVEWLKHGNLDNPITIFDDPSPSYYPINGSLFYLWLILPLRNVFMADLGQIPFFIITFIAVFGICRKLDIERKLSLSAASLFILIPNFFKQSNIAYVDIMVAAFFLVCVNFLFLLEREFNFKNFLIYSISFGLFLGTKTIALAYAILLFLPFAYIAIRDINKYKIVLTIIFVMVVVLLGGFVYVTNFMHTGNPLYPLDFSLLGKHIFKGVMDAQVYRAHFRIEDYRLAKLLLHEGLGAQTLIFILPAIFIALPLALLKNKKGLSLMSAYVFVLPIFLYLIYRYIIPLANTRYLYPFLAIGMVLGFYAAVNLRIPRIVTNVLIVICVLASVSELAKRQELVFSIILSVVLFFCLRTLLKILRVLMNKSLSVGILILLLVSALIYLNNDYTANEYSRYTKMVKYSGFWPDATKAWEWLNKNSCGNNVAYTGRPVPFPLYGTNFKNNVYYVSVNKIDPVKLHYFVNSRYSWGYDFLSLHNNLEEKNNYRGDAEYSVWLNNLLNRNIDFLFVYSLHQTKDTIFPLEDKWAKANIARFNPVFTNNTIHIYRLIR